MKKGIFLALLSAFILGGGCNKHEFEPIDEPPQAPAGLYSVTGNGKVSLFWSPNLEPDLREYALYTSDEEFGVYALDGATSQTEYAFYIPNGITKYLAVAAIDFAGHESDLSYETIWDTPRPEGFNLMVHSLFYDSLQTNFERCGIDFSDYNSMMIQSLDNPSNDVYVDNFEGVMFLNAFDIDTDIALYGLTSSLSEVDYVNPELIEWNNDGYVPLLEDFSYIIWTYDNHFATIRVEEVYQDRVLLDWAYQTDPGNPQLKTAGGKKFRQEKDRKLTLYLPKTVDKKFKNK